MGIKSTAYKLGNGTGFSVKQIIDTAREVAEKPILVVIGGCRAGDAAHLVADSNLAKNMLGWQPQYAKLATIIAHAW